MRQTAKVAVAVLAGIMMALAADPPAASAPVAAPTGFIATLRNGFTIRYQGRESGNGTARLYLSREGYVDVPESEIVAVEAEEAVPSSPPEARPGIAQLVDDAGTRHQLDPDFLHSVIRAESGYNPRAVSRKGAQGLMQLMPQTASELGVPDSFDPAANLEGGARYLRELLRRYNNDPVKALAAYNAGPQRVQQYGGVPPFGETRAYVSRIVRDFNQKKLAQRKPAAVRRPRAAKSATP